MEKSDSNASSKSSTDVEGSDKTIDTNSLDSLSENTPNIENKNVDEYGRRHAEDSQTIVEIRDPGQFVPTANINTSKEFNNNLAEYVLVTDNLSKPGLVVLDSEDNDEADKISILNNNLNIITTDRTAILPQQRYRSCQSLLSNVRSINIWFLIFQVSTETDDEPQVCSEAQWYQAQRQGEDCPQGTQNSTQLLVRLIPVIRWDIEIIIQLQLHSLW